MFLLFTVENAGKRQQSWSHSLGQRKRKPSLWGKWWCSCYSCLASRELILFSITFQLVDAPSLETLKVRLDLAPSTCSSCRSSCSLQGNRTSWPLKVLSNSMILRYLSFFKHFYLSTANDEGLEVKQLMRLGTAIFKTADRTAVLLS